MILLYKRVILFVHQILMSEHGQNMIVIASFGSENIMPQNSCINDSATQKCPILMFVLHSLHLVVYNI